MYLLVMTVRRYLNYFGGGSQAAKPIPFLSLGSRKHVSRFRLRWLRRPFLLVVSSSTSLSPGLSDARVPPHVYLTILFGDQRPGVKVAPQVLSLADQLHPFLGITSAASTEERI